MAYTCGLNVNRCPIAHITNTRPPPPPPQHEHKIQPKPCSADPTKVT